MNIQVFYREEEAEEGVLIAEVPFRREAIDAVIPLLVSWGVVNTFGGDIAAASHVEGDLYGQFRVTAARMIFEVVNPA